MVIVALVPGMINRTTTMTAITAGTMMTTTDSTASSCSHGCTLMAWAAAAAAAESMPRRQRQLGMRDSNGDGNGAAAARQRQWWQQWCSTMEKRLSIGKNLVKIALLDHMFLENCITLCENVGRWRGWKIAVHGVRGGTGGSTQQ